MDVISGLRPRAFLLQCNNDFEICEVLRGLILIGSARTSSARSWMICQLSQTAAGGTVVVPLFL